MGNYSKLVAALVAQVPGIIVAVWGDKYGLDAEWAIAVSTVLTPITVAAFPKNVPSKPAPATPTHGV